MITLLTLLFLAFTVSVFVRFIGWGIRVWFLIIGSLFFMVSGLTYYLLPILLVVLIVSLLAQSY